MKTESLYSEYKKWFKHKFSFYPDDSCYTQINPVEEMVSIRDCKKYPLEKSKKERLKILTFKEYKIAKKQE